LGLGLDEDDAVLRVAAEGVGLLAVDVPSGRVTPLLNLRAGAAVGAAAWSPDSSRLALVRYTFEEETEIVSPLKSIITRELAGTIPPAQNPILQSNEVDLINFQSGEVRQAALRAAADGGSDTFADVAWSPDNTTLAMLMTSPSRLAGRAHPIYLIPERTSFRFYSAAGQQLGTYANPALDGLVTTYTMTSPDEIVIESMAGSDIGLFVLNRAANQLSRLPLPPGASGSSRVIPGTRQVVFVHSSFVQPTEFFRINLDGSALHKLSNLNAQVAQVNQVRADAVSFTVNGQTFEGYLIQPAGAAFPPQNVPIVVWQEGGPQSNFTNQFMTNVENPFNALPNFGVAVLFMPLYGRYGFGVERFRALYDNHNFGVIDIDAQADIARQMIAQGWTSPGKLGITGCSYGGYFTSQSITRHPDLYGAAVTQCTLFDTLSEFEFGTRGPVIPFWTGSMPTVDPQRQIDVSPLHRSRVVRTPTLIIHGSRDFLPLQLAELFHDQLQENGVPVNMMTFVGDEHGLQSGNSQAQAVQLQLAWFRQYLGR
jgi:dipeptidyl aminopeptidase/acylaminoacyl peptidase